MHMPRYEVRSLVRGFELLVHLAEQGGEASITQLAAASDLPAPTVHRLVRSLVATGALRQLPSRRYVLGPLLVRLGEVGARAVGALVKPVLAGVADATGESANLAILDEGRAIYVAHVKSHRSMRMFTEIGRRVHLHSTGVGKAILAQLADDEVIQLIERSGLPARTERTITDLTELLGELAQVRSDGYAVDDEEEEFGVRCLAVPVRGNGPPAAVSVSAPIGRLERRATEAALDVLRAAADRLAEEP